MADTYVYEFEDPYAPKEYHDSGLAAEGTTTLSADDEYERFLRQQKAAQDTVAVAASSSADYYEEEVVTVEDDEEVSIEEEVVTVNDDSDNDKEKQRRQEGNLSVIHQHLNRGNWDALLAYLQELKGQDPALVYQALSGVDSKDKNPFHIAARTAPYAVLKALVGTLPSEYRETLLMKQDSEGNTPLHLACATMQLNEADGSIDAGSLRVLTKSAPRSQEVMNWTGDCPLHLLLTSPAFAGTAGDIEASHVEMAEGIVASILDKYPNLGQIQNFTGSSVLHTALNHGVHERVLLSLLDRVPQSSIARMEDKTGRLPLHCLAACEKGKGSVPITVAARLVDSYPGSLMMPCNLGNTPLHMLASNTTKNADQEYRKNPNTAKLAKLLLGSATDETMCPLLVQNRVKFVSFLVGCQK
jgi:hypothetical protein